MTTARLFNNGRNQAVRIPKEFEFEGISEVEIRKEGNAVIITPVHKSWLSYKEVVQADEDFLQERQTVIEEGRIEF